MHNDPTAPKQRKAFYYWAYLRVEAVTEQEALDRIRREDIVVAEADVADSDDAVNLVLTNTPSAEPVEQGPMCTCPPELVARGGFKSGCPVHA